MAVTAIQHIRQLMGTNGPHLMLCDDGRVYVVKVAGHSRGNKKLASEYIATELARWIGLPVPDCAVVDIPSLLIASTPELSCLENGSRELVPQSHFGSLCIGVHTGRAPVDVLPNRFLRELTNLSSFAGVLAFDKWCSNMGKRQAVFHRASNDKRYTAYFIDQGDCFCGTAWTFSDSVEHGLFGRPAVYQDVADWNSFEPFLSRLFSINPAIALAIAQNVPGEWYSCTKGTLEDLIERLLLRRTCLHELIARSLDGNPGVFPNWRRRSYIYTPREVCAALTALPPEASCG